MTMNLFNPKKGCCSLVTTGGTESNVLAIRAYKEWGYHMKGITEPEVIMSKSAHPSFDKGCEYFGVKLITVDLDPVTLQPDLE